MRKIILFFLPLTIFAQVHYAKLEPIQTYNIKSSISGEVIYADDSKEGSIGDKEAIVKIDDSLDRKHLEALKSNIEMLNETLKLNIEMADNQKEVYEREFSYYERIKDLKTKSKAEKDRVFAAMAASKNQYLSLREKIANIRRQISDVNYQIEQLKWQIDKKSIFADGLYVYKVAVKEGEYVNPGMLLLTLMDTKKGKLTIYLDREDIEDIENKKIYIDGKKRDAEILKVLRVADGVHISSYRVEIVLNNPEKIFSKLLKVELK